MTNVRLDAVRKSFSGTPVVNDVTFTVDEGSTAAVLGASGSGKSTLLRIIAGFERVDRGAVWLGERVVDDGEHVVHAQHRGIGYVSQDGALFPHLTVLGNVSFGIPRAQRARAHNLIDMVGLTGLERRYPHQLSGGQQQRVSLARALAIRPRVLLLDEPFSSLDAQLRVSVRRDIARIIAEAGTTTLLVTHDRDDALSLADQILVVDQGHLLDAGTPRDLYEHPTTATVAVRMGDGNLLPARLDAGYAWCALGRVPLDTVAPQPTEAPHHTEATVLLRPEQVALFHQPAPALTNAIVYDRDYYGHAAMVTLELDVPERTRVVARVSGSQVPPQGSSVWVGVTGTASIVDSDERISEHFLSPRS